MQQIRKLSDDDVAAFIGVDAKTYASKMRTGKFSPEECMILCKKFDSSFDFLFAIEPKEDEEICVDFTMDEIRDINQTMISLLMNIAELKDGLKKLLDVMKS